ncbi:MAG: hydrogen peroxide-inducible genes activator [Porticoccaceae bacterium]|nr:hydrogen peroxide-inducible genes activator [Porticoccaceae bacterium]
MVTLKQINYALAVAKTLHFKNAADACFISPSTLSMAIADLEAQLGVKIFERDNKKVIITQLGRTVLEKAKEIKLHVDDFVMLGQVQAAPLSVPISLGIIPTISPYLLPIVLPILKKSYPNLRLKITEDQSNNLKEKVQQGDIEMAILALPMELDGLISVKFWQEDFYYITHKDNMSAERQEIDASELEQSELLLLEDGHCLKDHALAACKFAGTPQYNMKVSSLSTLVQLVAGNMGSTLVPHMALGQLLSSTPLLAKAHLNQPSPHREIAIIARPNYSGIKNVEYLAEIFANALHESLTV